MRYQGVVLDSEMGSAMLINSIAWLRSPAGNDQGHYYDVEIYMGLCASDQLGAAFEGNWVPGTKTLVFSDDQLDLAASANEWEPVELDTPYWYSGQQNLLYEVSWGSANPSYSFYTWQWETGSARTVYATNLGSANGILSTKLSMLQFEGTLGLDLSTFGEVKASFGTAGGE